jgi:hypothetical protein
MFFKKILSLLIVLLFTVTSFPSGALAQVSPRGTIELFESRVIDSLGATEGVLSCLGDDKSKFIFIDFCLSVSPAMQQSVKITDFLGTFVLYLNNQPVKVVNILPLGTNIRTGKGLKNPKLVASSVSRAKGKRYDAVYTTQINAPSSSYSLTLSNGKVFYIPPYGAFGSASILNSYFEKNPSVQCLGADDSRIHQFLINTTREADKLWAENQTRVINAFATISRFSPLNPTFWLQVGGGFEIIWGIIQVIFGFRSSQF